MCELVEASKFHALNIKFQILRDRNEKFALTPMPSTAAKRSCGWMNAYTTHAKHSFGSSVFQLSTELTLANN